MLRKIFIGVGGAAIVVISAWLSFSYFSRGISVETHGTTAVLSTQPTTETPHTETTFEDTTNEETTSSPTTARPITTRPVTTRPTTTAPNTKNPVDENVVIVDGSGNPVNGGQSQMPGALWQRNFGYTDLYDMAAPAALIFFDTEKVFFNYDGLEWRIQFWKGQYNIYIGSEIGVYHKDENSSLGLYQCAIDENMLEMEMSLYRNTDGEIKRLFKRPYGKYWWITGFVEGRLPSVEGGRGHGSYDQSVLIMSGKITLKDAKMFNAFVTALKKNNAITIEKTYGTTVEFVW